MKVPGPDASLARAQQVSQELLARHRLCASWLPCLPERTALLWLPSDWACRPEQQDFLRSLLSQRAFRRIRTGLLNPAQARRAASAATDRVSLRLAARLLTTADGADEAVSEAPAPYLYHTSLGGPRVGFDRALARWARTHGAAPADLHISFTHDGDVHATLAAWAPGLRGIGIDLVHLPRLQAPAKNRDYLHRFARRFMSDEEFQGFTAEAASDDTEQLCVRVAAHFSLMESASKAVGTGLLIGGGMGRPSSLPKQSLNVHALAPRVEFSLDPLAHARCRVLGATRLEGHWAVDHEYLLSAALLWE